MHRIAVVGAGAVGLSTAVQIQKLLPSVSLTIIADKFTSETTSSGAAGIFNPTLSKTPGVPVSVLRTWLQDSWQHYHELVHSSDAGQAGVQMLSGFRFVNNPEKNHLEADCVYQHLPLGENQLNMFPGDQYKYGWFVTTVTVESTKYLPYLMKQFQSKGGHILKRKLSSLEELVGQYDVVVNCTGLGSMDLLGDEKLIPNRGHLIKVKAPWLKHFVYTGDDYTCYIIPGHDVVTIGGTRTSYDVDMKIRPEDSQKILANACKVVPSLKNAEILWEWIGLRPHREPLRVEKDILYFPSGALQVVHNYGHGAEGISLSWGTGKHAAYLVQEVINLCNKSLARL